MRFWMIVVTVLNTALAVVGAGLLFLTLDTRGTGQLMAIFSGIICLCSALSGYVNLWFLDRLARQYEVRTQTKQASKHKHENVVHSQDARYPLAEVESSPTQTDVDEIVNP